MFPKSSLKVAGVTLIFGIFAFLTGRIIWPPAADSPVPTASQLPFLLGISVLESLAFGLGVSFLLFGYKYINQIQGLSKNVKLAVYITITWLIISWWPHDNMHIHNGMNLDGLILIEYTFHATLIVSGLFLAYIFLNYRLKASK